jgi:hypothetical protein
VRRLTPSALKSLESVSRLTATDWSKARRTAAVETLRAFVTAFTGTYWCRPSEFPRVEAAATVDKPRRSGVLSRLIGS